jgi:hypothetical protein
MGGLHVIVGLGILLGDLEVLNEGNSLGVEE